MLEVVQIIFFSVSTVGVIIATINHFLFVRDRNAQTLISITNLIDNAHENYVSSLEDGADVQALTRTFLNVITVYCHMHNNNQIRPKTKEVHERYAALTIELVVDHDSLKKVAGEWVDNRPERNNEICKFIRKNHKLFKDAKTTISYFDTCPATQ